MPKFRYVIIDPGHHAGTGGKRSPKIDFRLPERGAYSAVENGVFREYRFNLNVANALKSRLESNGNSKFFTPIIIESTAKDELDDIVRQTKDLCKKYSHSNCIFLSLHSNAVGKDGQWTNARGWSGYVQKDNAPYSNKLADIMLEAAKGPGGIGTDRAYTANPKVRGITRMPNGSFDYVFRVIKNLPCAGMLVESVFHSNKEDVKYAESKNGFDTIVRTLYNGIVNFYNYNGKI